MNKKRKRKFTFTPCFHPDLSAEEFGKFKTAFISNYPKSGSLDEAVFCLFFSMLIDGVLPSNAPINFFYGIRLDRSDLKKKIIRMTRKNYASGIPIYLSSLSYVYLLNYLKKIKLAGFNTHELMPSQLFSKKEFQKKFRIWLSELGRLVNMNRTPSIKTLAAQRDVSLIKIYPGLIGACLVQKVSYSSFSDSTRKNSQQKREGECGSGLPIKPVTEFEYCLEMKDKMKDLFAKHKLLSDLSSSLSQFTSVSERLSMSSTIAKIISVDTPNESDDTFNIVMLAGWFHQMLSAKIGPNSVKAYFNQISYLLRTELLGQSLNGFSQFDAENILENCSYGKAKVLKAALKAFLDFAVKNFRIKINQIAWSSISKQQNFEDTPILWPSDINKITNSIESDDKKIAAILAAFCGMRVGEIASLSLSDFSLQGESCLYIRKSKTRSGRRWLPLKLLLPPHIHSYLSNYYYERLTNANFDYSKSLLINKEGLSFENPQDISNELQKLFQRLGYHSATFHTLRHSFASLLLLRWYRTIDPAYKFRINDRIVDLDDYSRENDSILLSYGLPDVARLLGHADTKTTVRNYIHTISLLQKAFLNRYEIMYPIILTRSQVMLLTGLKKASFYKRFTRKRLRNEMGCEIAEYGVVAKEVIAYLRKKF